jgi:hypothetical protein
MIDSPSKRGKIRGLPRVQGATLDEKKERM